MRGQCPAKVHANVPPEIRDKSIEYRVKNKEKDSYDLNDENDYNDKVTFASELRNDFGLNRFKINELHIDLSNSHVFTRYLAHRKYLEERKFETLYDAIKIILMLNIQSWLDG